jgi:CheY-like chemotaxis protein
VRFEKQGKDAEKYFGNCVSKIVSNYGETAMKLNRHRQYSSQNTFKNFLVVDDDISICKLIIFYLSQFARCQYATTPKQALNSFTNALKNTPYDAVFMDLSIPGIDGHGIIELFKHAENDFNLPKENRAKVVIVSAYDDIVNVSKSFYKSKATCFIKKPFSEESFIKELQDNNIIPPPFLL